MKNLLSELRRRNVFKMAVLFVVGGWMVLSVADILFGIINAPEGSLRVVLIVLAVGFPVALFLSWFFEITPEGLKLESEIAPDDSIASHTGRKMNFMIALGILMVAAGMAIQYFIFSEQGGLESIDRNSIAVLPFVDMSPDGDQEYFGDGIAEELLNLLAKMPELKVAARTSSFTFKDHNEDITVIGDKLRVASVLEGSIRKSGDQIRITAQLISVKDGYHLFSETYDRAMTDIFAIQDEIAAAVVDQLEIVLLNRETPSARRTDPEALRLFLQGRMYGRLRSEEGWERAHVLLRQALDIDPEYAPALAEIGFVTMVEAVMTDDAELYDQAEIAIQEALEIDPQLAEAWANLGYIATLTDWNYSQANQYTQKALTLDGNNPYVLRRAGVLAAFNREPERARTLYEESLARDPLSMALHVNLGLVNFNLGNFEAALVYFEKALEMSPHYSQGQYFLGSTIRAMGDPETALTYFEKEAMEGRKLMGRAMAYWDLGRVDESTEALDELIRDHTADGWGPFIAAVHGHRGEYDEAFALLEEAFDRKASILLEIQFNRTWISLHSDPRWPEVLERIDAMKK